jgi:protein TonB
MTEPSRSSCVETGSEARKSRHSRSPFGSLRSWAAALALHALALGGLWSLGVGAVGAARAAESTDDERITIRVRRVPLESKWIEPVATECETGIESAAELEIMQAAPLAPEPIELLAAMPEPPPFEPSARLNSSLVAPLAPEFAPLAPEVAPLVPELASQEPIDVPLAAAPLAAAPIAAAPLVAPTADAASDPRTHTVGVASSNSAGSETPLVAPGAAPGSPVLLVRASETPNVGDGRNSGVAGAEHESGETARAEPAAGPVAGSSGDGGSGLVRVARLVFHPRPVYPRLSIRYGEAGEVLCKIEIDAAGAVAAVAIARSSGYKRLDEAALAAVRRWRFEPARRGGRAQASTATLPVVFELKDARVASAERASSG